MKVLMALVAICWVLLLAGICPAEPYEYAVYVQQSPVGAGSITPGLGMHNIGAGETLTLTTVPKSGYHFVCWLGDVSDPKKNRTSVSIDGPKIVIAVFERDSYEMNAAAANSAASQGPERITPRSDPISTAQFTGGGSGPVPDGPNYPPPPELPDPIPEPATIAIITAGLYLLKNKNSGAQATEKT